MITVHVLTLSGDKEEWVSSVKKDLAHPLIQQNWGRGIPDDTGSARANMFMEASTPYVGFADPDDRTKTSAWIHCLNYLENNPAVVAVSTGQAVVTEDMKTLLYVDCGLYDEHLHRRSIQHVHGVTVMRTEAVQRECWRMRGLKAASEWVLTVSLIRHGLVHKLPFVGRYWRQHYYQNHKRTTDLHKLAAKERIELNESEQELI